MATPPAKKKRPPPKKAQRKAPPLRPPTRAPPPVEARPPARPIEPAPAPVPPPPRAWQRPAAVPRVYEPPAPAPVVVVVGREPAAGTGFRIQQEDPTERPPRQPGHLEGVPTGSARGVLGILILAALGGFFLLNMLGALLLWATSAPQPRLTPGFAWANVVISVVVFLFLPLAYVALVRPGERVWFLLGLRVDRRTPGMLALGLGVAILAVGLLLGIGLALEALKVPIEEESPLVQDIVDAVRAQPVLLVVIPLAAGLTEEVLFRGLLQPRIGLVASSVLFGLVHASYGTVLQIVVPFVLGFALGLVYRKTKTLWSVVSAHFFIDFIQLGLLLFGL